MRRFILSAVAVLWSAAVAAQPGPGPGPAPNPWTVSGNSISYAGCVLVPATVSGGCQGSGTISSRVFTPPATTSGSGLTVLPGVAPSAPVNGAIWTTTSGMFVRINGVTIGPLSGATTSSYAGTSPITVSFPAGVVTYAFDLSVANTFTASQTVSKATTTSPGWYAQITGDTVPRVRVGLNATDIPSIAFGPGNAVRDAFIERVGAGSLRLGAPDAASPVAQTWGVQGVVAGTSDTAGAAFTIAGSRGTGSGNGGDLQISVALPGSSGSTQNALTGILKVSGQTGALIWNTDNTYDIGATGATRPRDLWLGRNAAIAGTLNVTGHVTVEGVTSTGATGTGAFVFSNAPALVTPALGVATATTLAVAGCTIGANSFCATTGAFSSTLTSAAHTITSTASGAFTVGPAGATNPSLQVDASTASAATGLKIKSAAADSGLALSVITSGTNENLTLDAAGAGTITIAGTSTGAITLTRATTLSAALTYGGVTLSNSVTGTGAMVLATSPTIVSASLTTPAIGVATGTSLALNGCTIGSNAFCTLGTVAIQSTSATALAVGPNAATNPSFLVDASTASAATGLKVKGAAAAGGLALSVITSGTDENLKIDAAGAGTITLGGTSTGAIIHTRATTLSAALTYGGVALSNSVTGTGSMVLATAPTMSAVTVTGSFTATGLVTNADLVNSSITVNSTTCTLGSPCTITATAASITVGTTTVGSSADTRILRVNGSTLGDYTISGSGTVVAMQTGASLVTPAIGVATGTSLALNGCTIGTNALCATGTANISGATTLGGALTYGGVTLSNAVTGTGNMVLATSPSITSAALTTPAIGVATGTSLALNGCTISTNALCATGTANISGAITLGGAITYGGVTLSNAVTGTGNMALSASPTFTGTITAAIANFSGAVAANGSFTAAQDTYRTGTITPTALAADQNNYNPTSLSTASTIRLDGGAADRNITGLAGGAAGRSITIINIGTSNGIIFKNLSGSSTAANQFGLGADVTIAANGQSAKFWYDTTASLWRAESTYTTAGGAAAGTVTSVICATTTITTSGTCYARGQLVGTATNDDATAGNIGEYTSATLTNASATSVASITPTTIISVSLTAGDWDVWGSCGILPANTTAVQIVNCSISPTTNTQDTVVENRSLNFLGSSGLVGDGSNALTFSPAVKRVSLSGTTTEYLVIYTQFSVSTATMFGKIQARRVR